MKKSKNILEYYYLKYLNLNVHVGYKWIYIQIAADWYNSILTKNLVWEKLLRIILEALPLEKSHWNKLIKLKNHDFSAQTKIISKLNMVLKIFLKIFWYITRICNYNLNDILIINLNYDQRTCFYEWLWI